VDWGTPLLPEVVPEIDENPVTFYSGGGVGHGLELPYVKFKDPRCRLALPALVMRVHPTIFDLATPLTSAGPTVTRYLGPSSHILTGN